MPTRESVTQFSQYSGRRKVLLSRYIAPALADAAGRPRSASNALRIVACPASFPVEQLPYLTLWKNLDLAEGYVTVWNPALISAQPSHRAKGRRVPKSGRSNRRFTIDFAILTTKSDVEKVDAEIARIQGGKKGRLIRAGQD
jgi:hypothetical protein